MSRYELKGSAIRDTTTDQCLSLSDLLQLVNEHAQMNEERKMIYDRLGDIEQRLEGIPAQVAMLARSKGLLDE